MQSYRAPHVPMWFKAEEIGPDGLDPGSPVQLASDYWTSLRRDGQIPARSAIDPLDLGPRVLPWLFIVDVLKDTVPMDYRFRLVGAGNARLVGRNATGRLISEIFEQRDTAIVPETFDRTVAAGEPTFWRAVVPHDRVGAVEILRGLFPLAGNGRDIDGLLGCAVPVETEQFVRAAAGD